MKKVVLQNLQPILLAELLLSFGCPFCSNFAKQILSRPSDDIHNETLNTALM